MTLIILALILTAVFNIYSDDLVTKSGKVYKNFKIVKVTHLGVTVSHSYGMKNIPLSELPDDLAAEYGNQYKAKKDRFDAEAKKNRKKAYNKLAIEKLKKFQLKLYGPQNIIKITPKYILITTCREVLAPGSTVSHPRFMTLRDEYPSMIVDIPTKNLHSESRIPDNAIVDNESCPVVWQIGTAQYGNTRIKKYTYSLDKAIAYHKNFLDSFTSLPVEAQKSDKRNYNYHYRPTPAINANSNQAIMLQNRHF